MGILIVLLPTHFLFPIFYFNFDFFKRRLESAIEEAEQAVQPHIMNEQEIMHK